MAGHETIRPATGIFYSMHQKSDVFVMTGARAFKIILKKNCDLIAKGDHHCYQYQDEDGLLFVFFDDFVYEPRVKRYPDEFIAYPKHHKIEKRIMQTVEKKKKFLVDIL
jgi:hypothetical protein